MSYVNSVRRRLLPLILVVFGVSIVTFAISHMIPGDPARMMAGERASNEVVARMRASLGLDLPLHEQYLTYAGNLLTGDFGLSISTHRPETGRAHVCTPVPNAPLVCRLLLVQQQTTSSIDVHLE